LTTHAAVDLGVLDSHDVDEKNGTGSIQKNPICLRQKTIEICPLKLCRFDGKWDHLGTGSEGFHSQGIVICARYGMDVFFPLQFLPLIPIY
jgi:hypothetical protein